MATSGTQALLKKGKQEQTQTENQDLILVVAHEVENMTREQAYAAVPDLAENIEFNYFKLGGVLSVISLHKWWDEGSSFKEVADKDFNLGYRKAKYLTEIYDSLVASEIEWDQVKDLGWTKLRVLAKVINKENVGYWVDQAKQLTVVQLQELIKQKDQAGETEEGDENLVTTVTTLTFKLHEDQKAVIKQALEKAKEETTTDFDNVALERICTGYLGGIVHTATPADLKTLMQNNGWEAVMEIFGELWPQIEITVNV